MSIDEDPLPPIVFLALDCYRHPGQHLELLKGQVALPHGIENLLSFALKYQSARDVNDLEGKERFDAVMFFIENVLLAKGANYYRILGLNRSASDGEIKKNHRLMIRLFHPDRIGDEDVWRAGFASRINAAYNTLIHLESRQAYDSSLVVSSSSGSANYYRSSDRVKHNYFQNDSYPWWSRAAEFLFRRPTEMILSSTALVAVMLIWLVIDGQSHFDLNDNASTAGHVNFSDEQSIGLLAEKSEELTVPSFKAAISTEIGQDTVEKNARENVALPKKESNSSGNVVKEIGLSTDKAVHGAKEKQVPHDERKGSHNPFDEKTSGAALAAFEVTQASKGTSDKLSTESKPKSEVALAPSVIKVGLEKPPNRLADQVGQQGDRGSDMFQKTPDTGVKLQSVVQTNAAKSSIDADRAKFLLSVFIQSYESGNLSEFMTVFSPDVITDGGGFEFIRQDYGRLFKSTHRRRLIIDDINWVFKPNLITGQGRYTASVVYLDGVDDVVSKGRLAFELKENGAKLLISYINYTSD